MAALGPCRTLIGESDHRFYSTCDLSSDNVHWSWSSRSFLHRTAAVHLRVATYACRTEALVSKFMLKSVWGTKAAVTSWFFDGSVSARVKLIFDKTVLA